MLGPRSDEFSDPLGTTVVAQHVLSTGHLSLFGPAADYFRHPDGSYNYQAQRENGRLEYYFPLGPVVLAMPVVALANAFGFSADSNAHDAALQDVLIVLTSTLVIAFTYMIARKGRGVWLALVLAPLTVYGTVVGPTIGGAFWSINGEVLVAACVFLLLTRETMRSRLVVGLSLGALLFFGFLLRPSFASLIVCVLGYLALKDRFVLLIAAAVSSSMLAGFMLFSIHHFGSYLPPYYLASRLSGENARAAVTGLLFSPSRSIFIFSPLLIMLPCLAINSAASFPRLLRAALGTSILLQFLSNVFFPEWWGGASYGPRIFSSASYLGCVCVIHWGQTLRPALRRRMDGAMIGLLGLGVLINMPGLLSPYPHYWSARPPIDDCLSALFDWRYPEFLAVSRAAIVSKCEAQKGLLKPGVPAFCDQIP